MLKPPFLVAGDTIGILSTARKISKLELEPAISLFDSWNLKVKIGKSIGKEENQFAGSDAIRTKNFQDFLDDDSMKAIICARGGYGTMRIIDDLNFSAFAKKPKWIVGFSDITVFHSHIQTNFGIPTLHATMPLSFNQNSLMALDSLKKALFGEELIIQHLNILPEKNRIGSAEGILVGGNLSLLYALQGSVSDLNTDGKILFIEDLDEYLYHIDRMILSLKRAGKLKKLKGLIVGGMTDMRDNRFPFGKTAEKIIAEHVKEYDYPVAFNFPAGHITDNRSLYMGMKAKLKVELTNVTLTF